MSCINFYRISSFIHKSCSGHVIDLLSGLNEILWGDYLIFALLAAVVVIFLYRKSRQKRWHLLCGVTPGFSITDSKNRDGHNRVYFAKIRSHRRYWIVGELMGVYVSGLDTVTDDAVRKARKAIEKFMGTLLGEPVLIQSGLRKGMVYLPVNGLVKKKQEK